MYIYINTHLTLKLISLIEIFVFLNSFQLYIFILFLVFAK